MEYDYIIIGAGIGGLFVGSLLANYGKSVCILEQHTVPGGYGHSFQRKGYTFCSELHYLWNCGSEEDGGYILRRLGLENEITFTSLNQDCFDKLNFPEISFNLAKGFKKNIERLSERFPDHRDSVLRYYNIISTLHDEMKRLPFSLSPLSLIPNIFKFKNIIKFRKWTTQDLFDKFGFPLELQSILAGQSGNLLVPPKRASLLVHSAMVTGLHKGACIPTKGFKHIFDTIVQFINRQSECKVLFKTEVVELKHKKQSVSIAISNDGRKFHGKNFIFNGDPKLLLNLINLNCFNKKFKKKLSYNYSPSAFSVYLGLKDVNLSDYGFGSWNIWHYTNLDINHVFDQQLFYNDFNTPSLFISTPTLHGKGHSMAPPGCHQMVICTLCNYSYFKKLYQKSRADYLKEKNRITKIILGQIQKKYLPELKRHIDIIVSGTPLTMERLVFAPEGNSYGADLTPENYKLGKLDYHTPFPNLYLIGATAGIPSFAGVIHFSALLFEELTGEKVLNSEQKEHSAIG